MSNFNNRTWWRLVGMVTRDALRSFLRLKREAHPAGQPAVPPKHSGRHRSAPRFVLR